VKAPAKDGRHGMVQRTNRIKRRARRWVYWMATVSVVIDPWLILWLTHWK
jgi:hypothetical protein